MGTEISDKTRAFIVRGANEILDRQEWPFLAKTILGIVGHQYIHGIYMNTISEILKVDKKIIERAVYSLEKEGLVRIDGEIKKGMEEVFEDRRAICPTDEATLYSKSYGNDISILGWRGLKKEEAYKIMKSAEPFCDKFNYEKYFYIPIQEVKQLGEEINFELEKIKEETDSKIKNLEQKERKYILDLLKLPETTEFSRQITNGYFSWKDQTKCSYAPINAKIKYNNLEEAFKDDVYGIIGRAKIGENWWPEIISMFNREKEGCRIYLSNFLSGSDSLEKPLNSQEIAYNKRAGLIRIISNLYPEKQEKN